MTAGRSLWAGTYSRLPHGFWADARVLEAGERAAVLLLRMSSFADENSTDGRLSDRQVSQLGPSRGRGASLERLRSVGLLTRIDVPSGWEIDGWLDGHKTRAEKAELRQKRRSAGRKGGKAPKKKPPGPPREDQAPSKQDASGLLNPEQSRAEQSRATTTTTPRETQEGSTWQGTADEVGDLLGLLDETAARAAVALVVRRGLARGWSHDGLVSLASRAALKGDPPAWWVTTVDQADIGSVDPRAAEVF